MTMIHRTWKLLATIGLSLGLAATALAAIEPAPHQHHHGAAPAELTLNAGQKWATDAPLRSGMEHIRNALAAALPGIHRNTLSDTQYAALANTVSGEVHGIVANCKLEPQADAQLHLIIADMLQGVEVMAGKRAQSTRQNGAVQVVGALEKYAEFFDHPHWSPIRH